MDDPEHVECDTADFDQEGVWEQVWQLTVFLSSASGPAQVPPSKRDNVADSPAVKMSELSNHKLDHDSCDPRVSSLILLHYLHTLFPDKVT